MISFEKKDDNFSIKFKAKSIGFSKVNLITSLLFYGALLCIGFAISGLIFNLVLLAWPIFKSSVYILCISMYFGVESFFTVQHSFGKELFEYFLYSIVTLIGTSLVILHYRIPTMFCVNIKYCKDPLRFADIGVDLEITPKLIVFFTWFNFFFLCLFTGMLNLPKEIVSDIPDILGIFSIIGGVLFGIINVTALVQFVIIPWSEVIIESKSITESEKIRKETEKTWRERWGSDKK